MGMKRKTMKRGYALLLILPALAAVYLLAWPTRVDPARWTPPPPVAADGPYAYNERLKDVQRLAVGVGRGPEGIAVDAAGRVYAGYEDGRVIFMPPSGASYTEIANTGGRPLGLAFGPDGGVVVADARKGLLLLGGKPEPIVLSTTADGLPYMFPDDVDDAKLDKHVYFSDASSKFGLKDYLDDVLEHRPNGRLLSYDVESRETRVLLKDLYFANGVAVGPDDSYVLVNETTAYRITRYWLKGEKAGTHDVFADKLPGFPDNLSYNGRDRFWVAIASPRDALLEGLADGIFLRKVAARLPGFLQPRPARHSWVLGFDRDGRLVANLQYKGSDAYAPITSVEERGPWLYFGSLSEPAIGRIPLNRIFAAAPPPPAGWQDAPAHPHEQAHKQSREDDD
jgi:sugar lactone lactonase YvrE